MSLIVATALSPYDHDAREVGGLLGKKMGESVVLVHALEHHEQPDFVVRQQLENATHEARRFGTAVDNVLLRGDPLTALTDYASRLAPSFVIIGGAAPADVHGRGMRRKATHLIETLKVPLLCVPHAAPIMQSLMSGRHLRVLVYTEHNAKADEVQLQEVKALRATVPCDVTVLCASRSAATVPNGALRIGSSGHFDLVVLPARMLQASARSPFAADAPAMLFVHPDKAAAATLADSGRQRRSAS